MSCGNLFSRIDELESEYLRFWVDVAGIESPTSYKDGVDAVGKYFINKAKVRGWDVIIHEESVAGNAICITMNKDAKGAPICISGHMDTVHPVGLFGDVPVKLDPDTVPRDKAKIYGPGVTDCKGGIVAGFLAMAALEDVGYKKRPVRLILQSDEEGGSRYSDKRTVKFMYEMAKDSVAFLNTEGSGGKAIVIERKGIITYKIDVKGISTHSSRCYLGASAIREAAYKIIEIEKFKEEEGITCNVGVIEGGTVPNTVPDHCSFVVNVRFNNFKEKEQVEKSISEIVNTSRIEGCTATMTLMGYRVPMELNETNVALANKINSIFEENGLSRMPCGKNNGGSDAADMSCYGVPSVDSIGVVGGLIHSPKEYAYIASLTGSAKRIGSIIYCF